jgi:hypothetical protein
MKRTLIEEESLLLNNLVRSLEIGSKNVEESMEKMKIPLITQEAKSLSLDHIDLESTPQVLILML